MATRKIKQAWLHGARAAIKAAGGAYKISAVLHLSYQAVYKWTRVPAEHVITMERLCGGKVRREQMRPDLYPPEDAKSAA